MKNSNKLVYFASLSGIVACTGDFAALYLLGTFYPGYNHLRDTMSQLGTTASPVSSEISIWWIILGFLFIFFGIGFYSAFRQNGRYAKIATWLIILYGAGEGIGSGLFKADHLPTGLTTTAVIHNILGGIGVLAILLLPIIMQKVIPKKISTIFYRESKIIFITGLITILLFAMRYIPFEDGKIAELKGLWQRLFVLISYIYLITIAIIMIRKRRLPKLH
jgi:Protein of unknown function (DUF998)